MDKALLGYAEVSKETVKAKCLNGVLDLQAAHAHLRIGAIAANARDVVELTKDKAKEAYAPVKEVIDAYRPGKAA